jgi:hypothetical protein
MAVAMALPQVGALGQRHQVREPGLFGQVEHALGLVVHRLALVGRDALGMKIHARISEPLVGIAQEDEPQHRGGELGWLQARVGPELVGSGPEAVFNGYEI